MLIMRRVLLLSSMCFIAGMFFSVAEADVLSKPVLPSGGSYSKPVLPSGGSYSKPVLPSASMYSKPVLPSGGSYSKPVLPSGSNYSKPTLPSGGSYSKPVLPSSGNYGKPELSAVARPQISVSRQPSVAESVENLDSPHGPYNVQECNQFRQHVISDYGFTAEAGEFLSTVPFIMANENWDPAIDGGGHCHIDPIEIHMSYFQDEGALHEMAHAWDFHNHYTEACGDELVQATIRLSQMDPKQYPQYAQTIAEADKYVNTLHWTDPASYCPYEIYASFASFTMGQYQSGPRQLPEFMWEFYESLFTGEINAVPYYDKEKSGE